MMKLNNLVRLCLVTYVVCTHLVLVKFVQLQFSMKIVRFGSFKFMALNDLSDLLSLQRKTFFSFAKVDLIYAKNVRYLLLLARSAYYVAI